MSNRFTKRKFKDYDELNLTSFLILIKLLQMDVRMETKFTDDGFVVLKNFLSQDEMFDLITQVDRFITEVVPNLPPHQVFYEDKEKPESLKQIQYLFKHDQYFHDLMVGSKFEELAAQLLQQPVRPVNMQFFNKPAGYGRATPAHQDGAYFMLEPNEAVTMWLALDKVDEENGCLRYSPGSHRDGIRAHARTSTLGFSLGLVNHSADGEVLVLADPGDLAVHHAATTHRAEGNMSATRSRKALGFIYYSARAKESPNKERYQADLSRELLAAGRL